MFIRSLFLDPNPAPGAPPAIPPVDPARRADDFTTRMIAQHGTVENALRAVTMRMLTAEDSVAGLTAQVDQYKARLPEGSIVLPKAEAETFAKLKALGTPDEIQAKVKKAGELETAVARTEAEKTARAAAKAAGLDEDAFAAHALRENLVIELRDTQVTDKGKTVTKKMPFVRPGADDKGPLKAIGEYTLALPAHEQRALQVVAIQPTGVPYPEQRPTPTGPNTADPVGSFITKQAERGKARPNPLLTPAQPVPNHQPVGATP